MPFLRPNCKEQFFLTMWGNCIFVYVHIWFTYYFHRKSAYKYHSLLYVRLLIHSSIGWNLVNKTGLDILIIETIASLGKRWEFCRNFPTHSILADKIAQLKSVFFLQKDDNSWNYNLSWSVSMKIPGNSLY